MSKNEHLDNKKETCQRVQTSRTLADLALNYNQFQMKYLAFF